MSASGTSATSCSPARSNEEAAGGGAAGRASVHAALLRVAELTDAPDVAAFTAPGTLVERPEALDAAPPDGLAVGPRALPTFRPRCSWWPWVTLGGVLEQVTRLRGLCPAC